jgi:hypothetical protein
MKWALVLSLVLVSTGLVQAQGLHIRIVDADSGKPVVGATVERWASEWQPRILLPPGKFWFPKKELTVDMDGGVTIDKVARDDWYAVKAAGYEDGTVKRVWGKYQFAPKSGGKPLELVMESGVVVVRLKHSDPKPDDGKSK